MSFVNALRAWHDFYAALGTASAVLLGLLFLGLSLRREQIAGRGDSPMLALQSLGGPIVGLVVSFTMLVPELSQRWLGVVLLVLGAGGAAVLIRSVMAPSAREKRFRIDSIGIRGALAVLSIAGLLTTSVLILAGTRATAESSLSLLVVVVTLFFLSSGRSSWELFLSSGHGDRLKIQRGGSRG